MRALLSASLFFQTSWKMLDCMRIHGAAKGEHFPWMKNFVGEQTKMHIKAKDWEELLNTIRKIPQFKDFLQPRKCADIMGRLPEEGRHYPFIVPAAMCLLSFLGRTGRNTFRCKFSSKLCALPMAYTVISVHPVFDRDLAFPLIMVQAFIIEFPTVLEVLWSEVACPILEDLAFSVCLP
jgi:hypothetical protein